MDLLAFYTQQLHQQCPNLHLQTLTLNQTGQYNDVLIVNGDLIPVLRHGDFGTSNILYDPESTSVTGIIDFSSAGLGDPAVDFAALLASYGEHFYTQCCPHCPEMEHALNQVRFYCGTFTLQEALFGIENNDPVALRNGLASVN